MKMARNLGGDRGAYDGLLHNEAQGQSGAAREFSPHGASFPFYSWLHNCYLDRLLPLPRFVSHVYSPTIPANNLIKPNSKPSFVNMEWCAFFAGMKGINV